MSKLTLHFETVEGAEPAFAQQEVEAALSSLPGVKSAETRTGQYRSVGPSEIIAGITLAVAVVKGTTEAVENFTKLVEALKTLVESGKSLRAAFIDVGMRKVRLDQLTPYDVETIVQKAAA